MLNFDAIIALLATSFLALLSIRAFVLIIFSFKNYSHKFEENKDFHPFVSVVVPAYNEEPTLANCINGLVAQDYVGSLEILIVNDGSKDETLKVARKLASKHPTIIKVIDKPNGGKASALNLGIGRAKGEIIVCIDADSIFVKNTITQLVIPFIDKKVDAVTGNVRISNANNLLTKSQSIEYITGLNLDKRTFSELDAIQVISGCIGAFRKTSLVKVGGYSKDTLIEDMDLTVTMQKAGYKIIYNPMSICYTEAPENLKDLYKQRYRWGRGKWQVLEKHKEIILNPKYGNIGTIGIPYYLIGIWFNLITAFIMTSLLVIAILSNQLIYYLVTIAIFTLPIIAIFVYTLYIDKNRDSNTLPFYLVIQTLYYPYFIMYCDVRAWIDHKLNVNAGWNKLKRIGANKLPVL